MSPKDRDKTRQALGSPPTTAVNSSGCASGAALDPLTANEVDMLKLQGPLNSVTTFGVDEEISSTSAYHPVDYRKNSRRLIQERNKLENKMSYYVERLEKFVDERAEIQQEEEDQAQNKNQVIKVNDLVVFTATK